jgi:signal transduction histidine kinase/DNA-binding NarL/FixJ family response regulator
LPVAVLTTTTDHFVRGLFLSESIYGLLTPEWWRFLEHGGWVMFETIFLAMACRAGEHEMRMSASAHAEIEQLSVTLDQQRTILACQSDASLEGVLLISASGEALSCNRRFQEIWGLHHEAFGVGNHGEMLASASKNLVDPARFLARVAVLHKQPHRETTDLLPFRDGRVIELYTAPVRSGPDGYFGRGWYLRDVTARMRADAEVRTLNHELEQRTTALAVANGELEQRVHELKRTQDQLLLADRLASLGRVAASIGHEINNPLTYVMSNLEEILRAGDLSHDARELVGDALEGSERVRRIVGGLKSIARTGAEQREPVDLHAILDSSIRMASNEIRHRGRLIRDYGDLPAVEGDASRIGQVFLNLIVNAAQALSGKRDGGHVISIRTFTAASGDAVVEIEDTGEGMPAERIPHLFDPFFTTKEVGVGTGLGLSICHGIVSEHRGTIEVDSVWGTGSRFRVVLPALRDIAALPPPQPAAPAHDQPSTLARRSVLLVDDDAALLRGLKRPLARNHDIETCEGATQALALLASGRRFDVILCDLHMPGVTGVELHHQLGVRFPGLERTIIFMTGGAFTPEAMRFLRDCPNPSIEKPIDLVEVARLIREVADGAARPSRPSRAPPREPTVCRRAPDAAEAARTCAAAPSRIPEDESRVIVLP